MGWIGWRASWGVVAAVILVCLVPLLAWLLARDRAPSGRAAGQGSPGLGGRHWQRPEVLRHWFFRALIPLLLTPGFIGTVVFFHQVHVAEVKGWNLTAMAPGYAAYAGATITASFAAGWVADRFGPAVLLPVAVLPMGLGISLLAGATGVSGWVLTLALLGITQGMTGALVGTLLPFVYGTDHLGAVRSVATAVMVLSTAIGPGLTGLVIDRGISFPMQGPVMGLWCLILSAAMIPVTIRLRREA
jgi:MFS family permease